MSSSPARTLLAVFYLVIFLFATSDLKRFIFHVHISRVDRAPVEIYVDTSSSLTSLWYPISIGIIFNVFILIFSLNNFIVVLWRRQLSGHLCLSTSLLLFLFTIRFIVNITVTRNRNGLSTPTLVERSFLAPSLSLEEELTSITLDWILKCVGFIGTFVLCYQQKHEQAIAAEKRHELKLMSSFE
jgi:hypothetical protein